MTILLMRCAISMQITAIVPYIRRDNNVVCSVCQKIFFSTNSHIAKCTRYMHGFIVMKYNAEKLCGFRCFVVAISYIVAHRSKY